MTLVRAEISRAALMHNLKLIRQYSDNSPIWAVLKANAYGHSVSAVLPEVVERVNGIACARIEEALQIKEQLTELNSQHLPILVLGGVYVDTDFYRARELQLQLVVHSPEQFAVLQSAALKDQFSRDGVTLKVWVKINVGMNRLGFPLLRVPEVVEKLQTLKGVQVYGVLAHLGTADEPSLPETQRQMRACIDVFDEVKKRWPAMATSLSNSAHLFAAQHKSDYHYPWHGDRLDWVRPGISIYGASPFSGIPAPELGLKPVMTLRARIVAVRDLMRGESVGYGATWTAKKPARLFVVAFGYGDGYPRHIAQAQANWNGLLLQQAGRVSMDFTVFYCDADIFQKASSPAAGDYVEIWGPNVLVDDVARKSNTIGYERLTQIGHRASYVLVD